jgi:hypothetical protein
MLVGIGITWLLLATNRTSRAAISAAVGNLASTVDDIGTATGAFVNRTSEWGQQTAARVADRASDFASTVGDRTAELGGRARDAADGWADKTRSASAAVVATFEKAKQPFTGAAEEAVEPKRGGPAVSSTGRKADASAAEPIYERR